MIELFVEKQIVDINVGFATMLTMAIDDIKDFGAKNTTFSKSMILPGTKRNNVLFGNIFDVSGSNDYNPLLDNKGINFNAAISAKAYIFADNIQIFKGTFRILEVIYDDGKIEYEAVVFGELGGFIAKLGNLKIEALDFSAYNHTYSIGNIIGSQSNVGVGSGYVYPNNIDYGNYSTNKHDWKVGTMRPALFVKEYIDKIFTASGYTYDCDLFNTSRFKSLIIPHNRKILTSKNSTLLDKSVEEKDSIGFSTINLEYDSTGGTLGAFTTSDYKIFTFYLPNAVADIDCDVFIDSYAGFPTPVTVKLYKNATVLATRTVTTVANIMFNVSNIEFVTGDTVKVEVSGLLMASNFRYTSTINIVASALYPTNTLIGDQVKLNDTIPQNILQKDFVSSIVKLFNLYIFEDRENDKLLKIQPFVDFYAGASSEDWSLKIDRSKPMVIKPMSELNSRYYDFKFKKDADYYNDLYTKRYNEEYGAYKYDSQYEFANETNTVELIFSGTPLVGYSGEDKVYSTIFKRTGDVIGTGEESIDSNIRILQTKMITGLSSWLIKDAAGSSTLGTYTSYLYAGHLDDPNAPTNDIQFGVPKELFFTLVTGALNVNQFNVYWSSYMAEITDKDSKLLSATIKLNYKDIYNLDFSKLKWIDGSLFRLNKVIDFDATNENTCKVELLKIINKIY